MKENVSGCFFLNTVYVCLFHYSQNGMHRDDILSTCYEPV